MVHAVADDGQQDDEPETAGPPVWVAPVAEVTSNLVTWVAGMLDSNAGGAAAGVSPAVRAGAEALYTKAATRWRTLTQRGGMQVLEEAAATGVPLDELDERIATSDERLMLAGTAIDAGTRTVDQDKIRALGRALAAGVSDDALVDPAILTVLALADLEPPHVNLLRRMAEETPPRVYAGDRVRMVTGEGPFRPSAWDQRQMLVVAPGLTAVVDPVVATLTRHALITPVEELNKALKQLDREMSQRQRMGGPMLGWPRLDLRDPSPSWKITDFGADVVALLRTSAQ